jgi:methyl-accepting chemotaxis protein
MTNSVPERLDRVDVEDDLETVKEIMLIVARRCESISEAQDRTQRHLDQLTVRMDQLTVRVDQLSDHMGGLAIQMEEMSQQAAQDRSQAAIDRAEFRSTVQQLLDVLSQRFSSNGH